MKKWVSTSWFKGNCGSGRPNHGQPVGLIGEKNEESELKICKWYKVVPKNVSSLGLELG
jgi:hypothetical protein